MTPVVSDQRRPIDGWARLDGRRLGRRQTRPIWPRSRIGLMPVVLMCLLVMVAGCGLGGTDGASDRELRDASRRGDVAEIEALLQAGAAVDHRGSESGETPLMAAAGNDLSGRAVDALLGADASLEVRDDLGWTALHHAAVAGNVAGARSLLEAGADRWATTSRPSQEDTACVISRVSEVSGPDAKVALEELLCE